MYIQKPGGPLLDKLSEQTSVADIALVISDLGSGGAQRVVSTLANEWVRNGLRICVVTLGNTQQDFFDLDGRVRRLAVGGIGVAPTIGGRVLANLQRIKNLRSALKEVKAPIVVSFVLPMNILTLLAGFGLKCRIVVSERNDPRRQYLGWHWNIFRRILYRLADVVTANSSDALDVMKDYVPQAKLKLVPNPLSKMGNRRKSLAVGWTILAVGRLHEQKGYDILLDAFALLYTRLPAWRLAIVGDGPLRDLLRSQAKKAGLAAHVDWVGSVSDPSPYYCSAEIFVLSSRYEGVPNALLEAMSHGLPVVVTNGSPGPLEYVHHETSGLIVPVDNATALAAALERLITNPGLRQDLGNAARECVTKCSLEHVLPVWQSALGIDSVFTNARPTATD